MQQVSYWCDLRVWSKQEGESAETLWRIDQWIAHERRRIDECERLHGPRRAR